MKCCHLKELSVTYIGVIQMTYVNAARWPEARWDLAANFILGGGITVAAAAAFLRVVWRDYNVRRGKTEDDSDE